MAPPKAASWSQSRESWDCPCDMWASEKRRAICCHLIPKSLWSRCLRSTGGGTGVSPVQPGEHAQLSTSKGRRITFYEEGGRCNGKSLDRFRIGDDCWSD